MILVTEIVQVFYKVDHNSLIASLKLVFFKNLTESADLDPGCPTQHGGRIKSKLRAIFFVCV